MLVATLPLALPVVAPAPIQEPASPLLPIRSEGVDATDRRSQLITIQRGEDATVRLRLAAAEGDASGWSAAITDEEATGLESLWETDGSLTEFGRGLHDDAEGRRFVALQMPRAVAVFAADAVGEPLLRIDDLPGTTLLDLSWSKGVPLVLTRALVAGVELVSATRYLPTADGHWRAEVVHAGAVGALHVLGAQHVRAGAGAGERFGYTAVEAIDPGVKDEPAQAYLTVRFTERGDAGPYRAALPHAWTWSELRSLSLDVLQRSDSIHVAIGVPNTERGRGVVYTSRVDARGLAGWRVLLDPGSSWPKPLRALDSRKRRATINSASNFGQDVLWFQARPDAEPSLAVTAPYWMAMNMTFVFGLDGSAPLETFDMMRALVSRPAPEWAPRRPDVDVHIRCVGWDLLGFDAEAGELLLSDREYGDQAELGSTPLGVFRLALDPGKAEAR